MRVCPICDTTTVRFECPRDGYATIDLDAFSYHGKTDPLIGQEFGNRYLITSWLGEGGMGTVYLARDKRFKDRQVAVKVLSPQLSWNVHAVKRFHREAMATSRLTHPHTVRVFDFGVENDRLLYLVMEHLKGQPLHRVIATTGPMSPGRVVAIARQVLGALSEAHRAGIVHRDLKPKNLMYRTEPGVGDFVTVVDFGITKAVASTDTTSITRRGAPLGTPAYMSPEQAQGKEVGPGSDIYSLGVVLYELLAGRPPFEGENSYVILRHARWHPAASASITWDESTSARVTSRAPRPTIGVSSRRTPPRLNRRPPRTA